MEIGRLKDFFSCMKKGNKRKKNKQAVRVQGPQRWKSEWEEKKKKNRIYWGVYVQNNLLTPSLRAQMKIK